MNKLLVIDPQNDFCHKHGSLYVNNAQEDIVNISEFINKTDIIDTIYVTLDSHIQYQIFHPMFWVNKEGEHPKPFTKITYKDVCDGIWYTARKEAMEKATYYLKKLEKNQNIIHTIWPYHCLVGGWGTQIEYTLFVSLFGWAAKNIKPIIYYYKGTSIFTEHYSIIKAEQVDPEDKNSEANLILLAELNNCDKLFIAGEALDFCVYKTIKDIVEISGPSIAKKIYLLTDCTSPIVIEKTEDTYRFLKELGINFTTTKDVLNGNN